MAFRSWYERAELLAAEGGPARTSPAVSSIRELNRDSRANRTALAGATYAVLVCACTLFVGCGRVGLELWPYDAGGFDEADAEPPPDEEDSGVIDAGQEMDASLDDAASDTGVSYVD